MDREPIYLEKDDEITSVVDKLKRTEGSSLDIVIPKESLMLQSVINLKLLKRQAESLGKEITIVTQDKVGTKLAEQIGIPVVAKEGQIPKEVSTEEGDKEDFSDSDIEMKEKAESSTGSSSTETRRSPGDAAKKSKEDVKEEPPSEPEKKTGWFKKHRKGVLIAGGFGVLILMIIAYVYIPLANVDIRLAAERKQVDISFTADKRTNSVDEEEGVIPAEEVVEEVEKSETFKATGEKEVGERATGRVKVCNKQESSSFTLSSGTRITDGSNLVYRTQANVQVPAASVKGGDTVEECSVEVSVTAEAVGSRYNKSETGVSFSIPALAGAYRAESTTAFTGGSSKKVKFVTAADISKARESITKMAEDELKSKINNAIDRDILLEGAMSTESISASSSAESGSEVEEFRYTVKMKGTALTVTEDDLKTLAESRLKQEIGETKEIVETESLVSSTSLTNLNIEEGTFEAELSGEAYIATKIEEDEIRAAISGDPEAVALEYLSQIDGVDEVEINFFPSFYKRVPRINNHIYIKAEISKSQPEETEEETENDD